MVFATSFDGEKYFTVSVIPGYKSVCRVDLKISAQQFSLKSSLSLMA